MANSSVQTTGEVPAEEHINMKIVIDETLCYIWHYLKSSTPETLKRIVLSHFAGDAILEAKKVLWRECASQHNIEFHTRRNTPTRTQAEANISDIIDAFLELDGVTSGILPVTFVAADLSKLPRHHPEQLNELAILKRLDSLEKKCDLLENGVSGNHIDLTATQDRLKAQEDSIATQQQLIESIAKQQESNKVPAHQSGDGHDNDSSSSAYSGEDNDSDDEQSDSDNEAAPSRQSETAVQPTNRARNRRHSLPCQLNDKKLESQSIPLHSQKQELKSLPKATFRDVVLKKNQKHSQGGSKYPPSSRESRPQRRQQDPKHGSKSLRGAQENQFKDMYGFSKQRQQRKRERLSVMSKIFIYNVPNHDTEEDIRGFLSEKRVTVKNLKQVSHIDARRKSFVITVNGQQGNGLLNRHFWPEGIRVRQYQDRRQY